VLLALAAAATTACSNAARESAPCAESLSQTESPVGEPDDWAPADQSSPAVAPDAREPLAARPSSQAPREPAESHVPLEVLLRTPQGSSPPPAPDRLGQPAASAPGASPGALDWWKQRVHVEQRSDPIGPAGPRQGSVTQTEAGLRIPIDDSASIEGGVRVDQRDQPGLEQPERSSSPRVGVKVEF
jgi:hypothetical protein